MLRAAFTSRSCEQPQFGHSQCLICKPAIPRAAEGETLRTGCRSQSFVNFDKTRLVPSGLVGKHVSQHRPSCVAYGFRHTRLGKFGGADIADDDDAVLPSNPRGFLVKLMSARVGDLGVDRLDALLTPGALGARKRRLVPAVIIYPR